MARSGEPGAMASAGRVSACAQTVAAAKTMAAEASAAEARCVMFTVALLVSCTTDVPMGDVLAS